MKLSRQVAYHAAKAADAAYGSPDYFREWAERHGYSGDFFHFNDGGVQCYVAHSRREQIVAFRGSDEAIDFYNDLRMFGSTDMQVLPGVWVYRSIYAPLLKLAERIRQAIDPVRPCLFTGHSKGAAECLYFRYLHAQKIIGPVHVFGCPGCFNWSGKVMLNNQRNARRTYCWRNNNDIVTLVPLRAHRPGWQPYITAGGKLIESPRWYHRLWGQVYGRYKAWKEGGVWMDGLRDHYLAIGYLPALEKLAK